MRHCIQHDIRMGPNTFIANVVLYAVPLQLLLLASRASASSVDKARLEFMYLKYKEEPIDIRPTFNPDVLHYEATLDWKMKFFAVQARPVVPAVVDSVRLCRRNADCMLEEQRIVVIDLSRNIVVAPGDR